MPLDTPLAPKSFPHTRADEERHQGARPRRQYRAHARQLRPRYRYNVILKDDRLGAPGLLARAATTPTRRCSRGCSACAPSTRCRTINLTTHLTGAGRPERVQPGRRASRVAEVGRQAALRGAGRGHGARRRRDRRDRAAAVPDPGMRGGRQRRAGARDGSRLPARRSKGCLVLVGEQGVVKTKGLRKLLPPALRRYFKEGITLDLRNKDSLTTAVSCWMAELGELEGTFKKTDIADIKSFLSQTVDEIRAPFARKRSKFARRTAFTGTVNDLSFLADETGNRRFWPLTVGTLEDRLERRRDRAAVGRGVVALRGRREVVAVGRRGAAAGGERRTLSLSGPGWKKSSRSISQWGSQPDWRRGGGRPSRSTRWCVHRRRRSADAAAMKTIGATLSRLWKQSGLATDRQWRADDRRTRTATG